MVKAAVIGIGNFGKHHARAYEEMPNVELAAVVDPAPRRGTAFPDVPFYTSCKEMLSKVKPDVASVVVRTEQHYAVAKELIEHGVHVLVEKPLARTSREARLLVKAGKENGVVLAVGHVERFNPIVIEMKKALSSVKCLTAVRMGPEPREPKGMASLLDLIVHDIDLANYLSSMAISGAARIGIGDNFVSALIHFIDDTSMNVIAGWSKSRVRSFTVTDGMNLYCMNLVSRRCDSTTQEIRCAQGNPLKAELEEFVSLTRGKGARTIATGEDGLVALELAEEVISSW